MAPGRIDSSPIESLSTGQTSKPRVYLLDTFHPTALKHAQSLFDAILPGDKRHEGWREKAEYLLIRNSYLTADDVKSCPGLKAIGKQGVGTHIARTNSFHRLQH
jgi:phosphoglycerate dehydrogenase-like enzyme